VFFPSSPLRSSPFILFLCILLSLILALRLSSLHSFDTDRPDRTGSCVRRAISRSLVALSSTEHYHGVFLLLLLLCPSALLLYFFIILFFLLISS